MTAKHELAHLLLHHKINRALLPRWLDEGFAQWAGDGISEIITGNRTFLANAVIQRNLIPLHKIAHYFPESEMPMILAYEQSKSFVESIHKEFGAGTLLNILHHMSNGNSIDDAVLTNLAIPLDALEHLWHKD